MYKSVKTMLIFILIFHFSISIVVASNSAPVVYDVNSLTKNGSFELVTSPWTSGGTAPNKSSQNVASHAFTGNYSRVLSASGMSTNQDVTVYQNVAINQNTNYYATAHIFVESLHNARVQFEANYYNSSNIWLSVDNVILNKTGDHHTTVSLNKTTPANTVFIRYTVRLKATGTNGSGTAYVDDMNLSTRYLHFSEFETMDSSEWDGVHANPGGVVIRSDVSRNGGASAEFSLSDTDAMVNNGVRAELYKNNVGKNLGEYWYGFSTYLPKGFQIDSQPEVVAQWHAYPDTGEMWRSPSLALEIIGDHWRINKTWDDRAITTEVAPHQTVPYQAPFETEKWTDWVFHIRWDYHQNGVGLTEVWKDGVKVLSLNEPNSYHDISEKFFKIGIYKWTWNNGSTTNVRHRTLYHDSMKVTDSTGSFLDVSPAIPK